jgi:hypothetical protein
MNEMEVGRPPLHGPPPPPEVAELSEACVRFVEGAVGLKLDYEAETLPVLDHYLASRRAELEARPEALGLIARAAGAYFGEVVRRRLDAFWHVPSDDPSTWELRARPVYLAFNPVAVAYDTIRHGDESGPVAQFTLDDADREEVETRLSELPVSSDEEFYALSTRLEVLDITVETAKSRMMREGLGEVQFDEADYEDS